jgi:Heterokaryon incompatibility protein (HET)
MRKIYQNAKTVLVWLGPDTQEHQAKVAIDSILTISDFLCRKLGISVSDPSSMNDTYQELVLKKRDNLPLPNECEFSTDAMWESLIWFYSHPYFSRVWVIQEIGANKERLVHCGREKIEWDRVDLVASYIIMEPAFSKSLGFSSTYCWWVASVTELVRQHKIWLAMLYLVSNFSCFDERDVIYSLRGLMEFSDGAEILDPDYNKSTVEVYRDSVEAAFVNFQNTNVLLYITGNKKPSWIPRWDQPMLFRNPFRFGKAVPWKPAGETKPIWIIDKKLNVLSLSGFIVDPIEFVESYNESFFGNMTKSDEGRNVLKEAWQRILKTVEISQSQTPLSTNILTAAATSFSFGLDEKTDPADERRLLHNFVAYLKIVLDEETYNKYIPPDVSEESEHADGHAFGKPVWDFEYPESSFFITEGGFIGCSISTTRPGDMVCVALGSTYPYILRPDGDHFFIRGYSYVHGIMHGEQRNSERQVFKIR